MRSRIAIGLSTLLILAGSAGAARADSVDTASGDIRVTRSVAVRYSPDALDDDERLRALHARIDAAARRVCGQFDSKQLYARARWRECYEDALADALEQVGDRRLAALRD